MVPNDLPEMVGTIQKSKALMPPAAASSGDGLLDFNGLQERV